MKQKNGQQACQGDYFKECVPLGQDIHNSKIFPLDSTDVDFVRELEEKNDITLNIMKLADEAYDNTYMIKLNEL